MKEIITVITCDNCGKEIAQEARVKNVDLVFRGNSLTPDIEMNVKLCLDCCNGLIHTFKQYGGE